MQRHPLCAAAALPVAAGARVIDEHAPHQARRDAEEVRAILPPEATGIGEFRSQQRAAFAAERDRWAARGDAIGELVEPTPL